MSAGVQGELVSRVRDALHLPRRHHAEPCPRSLEDDARLAARRLIEARRDHAYLVTRPFHRRRSLGTMTVLNRLTFQIEDELPRRVIELDRCDRERHFRCLTAARKELSPNSLHGL